MRKFPIFFSASCLLLTIVFLSGCSSSPQGTYTGFCRNETYGAEANLELMLMADGDKVSGSINITGPLNGSSAIEGIIEGDRITFTSDSGEGMPITWMGSIEGDAISGAYIVSSNHWNKMQGAPDQGGIWHVEK